MKLIFCVLFYFSVFSAHAQDAFTGEINLIPRNVYVGDLASLIITLPPSNRGTDHQSMEDLILLPHSPDFPRDMNIDFHRIVLERRAGADRLLIEFTAFVPGLLEFPEIKIGGESFTGFSVNINSIIDTTGSVLELSAPASSLAMPGTAALLYGVFALLVSALLLILLFSIKGKKYLRALIIKWNLWKHILIIRNTENRLQKKLQKGGDMREILDKISLEFRIFLSFITGNNCLTMTSREFETISDIDGNFLCKYFKKCDELRFSGIGIEKDDILNLLKGLRSFLAKMEIGTLEKTLREKAA